MYYIYILRCSDNSLYTGLTNNLERRAMLHESGKGSKYVRSRLPFKIVYTERLENRSLAAKREIAIKKLNKKQKEILISSKSLDK